VTLLAIGASTGGPQALATVLGALPADFGPAVLVVQHMAEGFIPGLVSWLDQLCPLPVVMGATGRRLMPGTVTIAPSGLNLLVRDHLRVVCEPAPERQFHVPGIDASFESIAESVGAEAIGVLLTGMGRDGAAGLKAMRERGALTIGQDEATSAVYGMPAAAFAAGAVEHQLPLPEIAPLVLGLLAEEAP
jgi:chemotaxis response regulator CheB